MLVVQNMGISYIDLYWRNDMSAKLFGENQFVKVRNDLNIGESYGGYCYVDGMERGTVVQISRVDYDCYHVKLPNSIEELPCVYTDEMLGYLFDPIDQTKLISFLNEGDADER